MTATGQVLEPIAMKETLEKAVELIGYGQELPEDEAIGVACGWWPSFASPSGAYVKLNADGTGTIITGAQENGTGAVMALPTSSPRCSGCSPRTSRSSTRTPTPARGTWARPARRRRSTTAAPSSRPPSRCASSCSTRPPRSSRRRGRISSWPDGAVARQGLAGQVGHDRRAGRRRHLPRQGLGRRAGRARGDPGRGLRRPARARVVPRAAADHARRARQGRPRDRRRARARGRGGARLRHDPQPDRRRRPGLRRRRDGHRAGALRGHAARRGRPPAQPAPARLQARDRRRRAADRHRLGRDRHAERRARRARRASASRRACRPRARSRTRSRR